MVIYLGGIYLQKNIKKLLILQKEYLKVIKVKYGFKEILLMLTC